MFDLVLLSDTFSSLIFNIALSKREVEGFSKNPSSRGSPWLSSLPPKYPSWAGGIRCGQLGETSALCRSGEAAVTTYPRYTWAGPGTGEREKGSQSTLCLSLKSHLATHLMIDPDSNEAKPQFPHRYISIMSTCSFGVQHPVPLLPELEASSLNVPCSLIPPGPCTCKAFTLSRGIISFHPLLDASCP